MHAHDCSSRVVPMVTAVALTLTGWSAAAATTAAATELLTPELAASDAQQTEPLTSELLCDWLALNKKQVATGSAVQAKPTTVRLREVVIRTQPIFSEETVWLHRFANWAHITTRPATVAAELPFQSGDTINTDDLAEAERLLREKSYLNDANVRLGPTCYADGRYDVIVETADNWSLLPSLGFGRSGGENKYAVGFKEDNFLGFGVRTSLKYQSDVQRSGYELKLELPLALLTGSHGRDWFAHSYLTAEWTNNDDGYVHQLLLDKPFYQDDSRWMYRTEWLSSEQQLQVFHNGALENVFGVDKRRLDLTVGQLWSYQDNASLRLLAGILLEDWRFSPADVTTAPQINGISQPTLLLPLDRSLRYPWLGLEYKQHDYRVLRDILYIDRAEDVNFGWHSTLKLGVQSSRLQAGESLGYRVLADTRKGFGSEQNLLLLTAALDYQRGALGGDFTQWQFDAEDYYRLSADWTWYNKTSLSWRNRNWLDAPLELGGDSGLRGYPLQYQHGTRKALLTTELRWYPRINLYRMLDLGFVAFADVGRASGGTISAGSSLDPAVLLARQQLPAMLALDPLYQIRPAALPVAAGPTATAFNAPGRSNSDLLLPNLTDRWLGSVGLGMRIYSAKSSNNHVVHLDLSTPLTNAPGVDSWEIELSVSNRF